MKCLFAYLLLSALPALTAPPPVGLTVQSINGLFFGGLPVEASGGVVTLTADDQIQAIGSGIKTGALPAARAARFVIQGPANHAFQVQVLPPLPALQGPGAPIHLSEWISAPAGMRGVLDASGRAEFRLGARADVGTHPVAGLYKSPLLTLQVTSGACTATTTFEASFIVRSPLVLSNLTSLDFGELIAGAAGGTIQLRPDRVVTFGGSGLTLHKGAPSPASFDLNGPAGTQFNIMLPTTLLLKGPGAPLQLREFKTDTPLSGILPSGGLRFNVGGTLEVGPNAVPGQYQGMFSVIICYQ